MKRSEINRLQLRALALFAEHRFSLPLFARWAEADWRGRPAAAHYCALHQMGWDLTDFGSGRFEQRGLVILCVRNGLQGVAEQEKKNNSQKQIICSKLPCIISYFFIIWYSCWYYE